MAQLGSGVGAMNNMLFYSMRCPHSVNLLKQIKMTVPPDVSNNIVFYCIDNPSIKLPQFIKVVPSFYIPSQRVVLTDADIMKWFSMVATNYRQQMAGVAGNQGGGGIGGGVGGGNGMQSSQQSGQYQGGPSPNLMSNFDITGDANISAYLPVEMGHSSGINYTYIDDDSGLGKNFFHIDAEGNQSPQSEQFNNKGMMGVHAFTRPPNEADVRPRTEKELTETIYIKPGQAPPQGGGPITSGMGGGMGGGMASTTYNPNAFGNQQGGGMGGGGGIGGALPFEQIKVEKGGKSGSAKLQYQQLMASRNEEFKMMNGGPRY